MHLISSSWSRGAYTINLNRPTPFFLKYLFQDNIIKLRIIIFSLLVQSTTLLGIFIFALKSLITAAKAIFFNFFYSTVKIIWIQSWKSSLDGFFVSYTRGRWVFQSYLWRSLFWASLIISWINWPILCPKFSLSSDAKMTELSQPTKWVKLTNFLSFNGKCIGRSFP